MLKWTGLIIEIICFHLTCREYLPEHIERAHPDADKDEDDSTDADYVSSSVESFVQQEKDSDASVSSPTQSGSLGSIVLR